MEISAVRRRVQQSLAAARTRAQERRQQSDEAARDYAAFLQNVATPVVQQIGNVLKAEGLAFTVSTPGDGLRLTLRSWPRRFRRVRARHKRRPPAGDWPHQPISRLPSSRRRAPRQTRRVACSADRRRCARVRHAGMERGWGGSVVSSAAPSPRRACSRVRPSLPRGPGILYGLRRSRAGDMNRHQAAKHTHHPHVRKTQLLHHARHTLRRRDRCGSIPGCIGRCLDRGEAR